MATIYPAQLAGLTDKNGSLIRGRHADLLLIKKNGKDPYSALLNANSRDVRLVVIGGQPVCGDSDLMEKLVPADKLESLPPICGKVLYLGGARSSQSGKQVSWKDTAQQLASALQQWAITLSPRTDCN